MNALAYLDSLVHFGQKLGLETTEALCAALGHPERAYPTLLIAGTNGKGSVAAYLDRALRESGFTVGRYTSPHLVRVHERIVIQGAAISDEGLETHVAAVRAAASGRSPSPTYFEVMTVAAFHAFRAAAVDVAVLEVGMGGRLDATNVAAPHVSAIVTIDFDHQAYLGHTLAAIAREKAGVLRAGRACVLGPLTAEARGAIRDAAVAQGAFLVDALAGTRWSSADHGLVDLATPTRAYRSLRPLEGAHQRDNLAVAVRVLEEARAAGLPVDLDRIAEGLSRASWPGRLQWIPGHPRILLDGAHNLAGAEALADYLRDRGSFVLVFGVLRDKAYAEMAEVLFPLAREVVVTQPSSGRAAEPPQIASSAGCPVHQEADVATALARARAAAQPDEFVVVAGSLYLVGEVLEQLGALVE